MHDNHLNVWVEHEYHSVELNNPEQDEIEQKVIVKEIACLETKATQ